MTFIQQEGISSFLGAMLTSEDHNLITVLSASDSQILGSTCSLISILGGL